VFQEVGWDLGDEVHADELRACSQGRMGPCFIVLQIC